MDMTHDRTRTQTASDLLAWHVAETNQLLKDAVNAFFDTVDDLTAGQSPETRAAYGELYGPFLDKLQEAGDQFDLLHALATGRGHTD